MILGFWETKKTAKSRSLIVKFPLHDLRITIRGSGRREIRICRSEAVIEPA